jgi:hypothetical protein
MQRARPIPRTSPNGEITLTITPDDCIAFGYPPVSLTLTLSGTGFLGPGDSVPSMAQAFPGRGSYLSLYGPPGGHLSVNIIAADRARELDAVVRGQIPTDGLRLGPPGLFPLGGVERPAIAYAYGKGPEWAPSRFPGGCAVRAGPLVVFLEQEGFCPDLTPLLESPSLGAFVRGFRLDE